MLGLQAAIDNHFQGKPKKWAYLTYVIVNVALMLILFYLVLNTYAYNWTGQLYPAGSGFNLATGADLAIPFVPQMAIFYVFLFYPLSILTMAYFAFVEYKKGYALSLSLVAINAVAILIYIVFPVSTFWYRQDLLMHPIVGSFWADQVYSVFQRDTSFNCFPSLHAAVSTICAYAWLGMMVFARLISSLPVTKSLSISTRIIAGRIKK